MRDLIQSTLAVIFMACPHRDSQYGKLSDAVISMASTILRTRADDPVLQDLSGANSAMLNVARQSFVRLWNDYNFRVRTYQENVPIRTSFREQRPEHVSRTYT
jgi:protein SERAC1